MTPEEATETLGLSPDEKSLEAIDIAYRAKGEELDEKILEAPTPALGKKYMAAKNLLVEARDILKTSLGGNASSNENLPVVEMPTLGKVETLPVIGATTETKEAEIGTTTAVSSAGNGVMSKALVVLLVIAIGAGGAYWWFQIEAPKRERAELIYADASKAVESKQWAGARDKLNETIKIWVSHPQASSDLEKVKKEITREVDRALTQARIQQSQEEWEDAVASYQKVLNFKEDHTEAQVALDSLKELLADARGSIKISTTPGAASVIVAGKSSELSPASFGDLKIGMHKILVEKKGFEPEEIEVRVSKDALSKVEVRLDRSKGVLRIESEPSELSFLVNAESSEAGDSRELNFSTNGETPALVPDLPTGSYQVLVSRPGWPDYQQTVEIGRDDKVSVSGQFGEGMLKITSDPSGATVSNNGQEIGKTPLNKTFLSGSQKLILSYPRLDDVEQTVNLPIGGSLDVAASFRYGRLSVSGVPKGASVVDTSGRLGNLGSLPIGEIIVPPGTYSLRTDKADTAYIPKTINVQVNEGKSERANVELDEDQILKVIMANLGTHKVLPPLEADLEGFVSANANGSLILSLSSDRKYLIIKLDAESFTKNEYGSVKNTSASSSSRISLSDLKLLNDKKSGNFLKFSIQGTFSSETKASDGVFLLGGKHFEGEIMLSENPIDASPTYKTKFKISCRCSPPSVRYIKTLQGKPTVSIVFYF